MTRTHRHLAWLALAIAAVLLSYFSFRGYLTPELLIHFANTFAC